jgi:hypothetical protein
MPRKGVCIDLGEQFANIESIMIALNQAAAEQARRSERSAAVAARILLQQLLSLRVLAGNCLL